MIKRRRPCRERLLDLPKTSEAGELRKKKSLQVTLTGPGTILLPNAPVAVVLVYNPLHDTTIKRFQKTMKSGRNKGHGRPQNHCLATLFWPRNGAKSAVYLPPYKKSRTAVREGGNDGKKS